MQNPNLTSILFQVSGYNKPPFDVENRLRELWGKTKKVLSRSNVCSLELRAGNAHDQNERTLKQLP